MFTPAAARRRSKRRTRISVSSFLIQEGGMQFSWESKHPGGSIVQYAQAYALASGVSTQGTVPYSSSLARMPCRHSTLNKHHVSATEWSFNIFAYLLRRAGHHFCSYNSITNKFLMSWWPIYPVAVLRYGLFRYNDTRRILQFLQTPHSPHTFITTCTQRHSRIVIIVRAFSTSILLCPFYIGELPLFQQTDLSVSLLDSGHGINCS